MSIAYDCWRLSVSGVSVGVWIDGVWNGHFLDSDSLLSEAELRGKIPEFQHSPNFRVQILKTLSSKNLQL